MHNHTAAIANITEQSYLAHPTYGTFPIAGRDAGQGYALTRVTPRTAVMDYGDKRVLPLEISAREIAEDLCREINSDAGENSFLGVFVCAGDTPTEEELRRARVRLEDFYRALVAAADREWERSHSFLFINDLERPRTWAWRRNGSTRSARRRSVRAAASASSRAWRCARRATRFSTARKRWRSASRRRFQSTPAVSRRLRRPLPAATPRHPRSPALEAADPEDFFSLSFSIFVQRALSKMAEFLCALCALRGKASSEARESPRRCVVAANVTSGAEGVCVRTRNRRRQRLNSLRKKSVAQPLLAVR